MLSMFDASFAAPLSRSHSKARMVKLEFDGPEIAAANEIAIGVAQLRATIHATRRSRRRGLTRAGSGRRGAVLAGRAGDTATPRIRRSDPSGFSVCLRSPRARAQT